MKNEEDDKIKMKISSNRQFIDLRLDRKRNNFLLSTKNAFILIILLIILLFFFSVINIKFKGKRLKEKLSLKSLDNSKNINIFLEKLKLILDNDELLENEMMSRHTTFKLGGPAKFFTIPKSINKIIEIIHLCKEYSIEYFILGNGSNLLVSDSGYEGLIINIHENNFSDLKVEKLDELNYKIIVGGGILMRNLAQKMCLLSLSGLEDIIDIPGTIGGGIIMNASAGGKGLIFNSLERVKIITPDGDIKELTKSECQLKFRGSLLKDKKYIVIEAVFKMIKGDKMVIQKILSNHTSQRYANQPMYFPSAGSFFMWNKSKYGSLYEKYKENNLVGYKVGDAMIYTFNIAFIVNLGNAKSSEVYGIVMNVEKIMKAKYNIDIKKEVVILGAF